jgi:hypothetical protein
LSLLKLLAELAPEEVSLKSRLSSWITAQSGKQTFKIIIYYTDKQLFEFRMYLSNELLQ